MNIVLFGPPGSGKGTQAEKLVKDLNLIKVSTGDLLREEIDRNSELGIKIKETIAKGKLASDDIINKLIETIVCNKNFHNRIIFDGYPRNLNQAKNLDAMLKKYNQRISNVISLLIDKETLIKRILGRQICSKCNLTFNKFFYTSKKDEHKCGSKYLKTRTDDNEETIDNRYQIYLKETLPVLKHYKNQNILTEIDGMKEIDKIYREIRGFIDSLET